MFKNGIKIFLISFTLTLNLVSFSQINLVPNGSFETYSLCPNSDSQIYRVVSWDSYLETPDYYNSCASYGTGVSIPSNAVGFQYAASGNGYIGLYTFFPPSTSNRETVGCKLNSSLTLGTKYFISFKTNLCSIDSILGQNTATDHLGARFFTVPCSISAPTPTNNFAHIFSTTIITDTLNWKKIFGSFIADSSYNYLSLGNFFDNSVTNKIYFDASSFKAAYYFIDDVCVSTDSSFSANWTSVSEYAFSEPINIYPNPFFDFTTVDLSNMKNEDFIINLFDISGRLILSELVKSEKVILKKENLNSGIYLLKIINRKKEVIKIEKLIIY